MPKAMKPKVMTPHGMVLRRRGASQPITSAGPSQASVPSPRVNSFPAPSPFLDPQAHPSTSQPHLEDNLYAVSSTPLSVSTPNEVEDHEEELADTQILGTENNFPEVSIANLANIEEEQFVLVDQPIQVVSRVSRLRRGFAQLSNLDPPSPTDDQLATQEATQAVAAASFSEQEINEFGNIYQFAAAEEDEETQVVATQARFSEEVLQQLANVEPVEASASQVETQVVATHAQFSERMAAVLGNVDLASIAIGPTPVIENDDWDEGATIRTFSQVPKSDTPTDREVGQALSKHTTIKSWASGSLTTSMRELVGLPPKPLKNGKLRPVPEDLGPAPARWPCKITLTHPTCGHTSRTIVHSHLCYHHEEKPGQRIYRDPSLEPEVLDEWGLPPSAQQPRSTQGTTQSATQVIREDDEECYESTSSIVLPGTVCDGCKAAQAGKT